MITDGRVVLAAAHGPQPRTAGEQATLLDALCLLAGAGADVRLLAADPTSAYLLSLLGSPQPEVPTELVLGVLPVVAAHPGYPLVAAWPHVTDDRPGCSGHDAADAARRALSMWVTRVVEAAYELHTSSHVDLVVADSSAASRAVALMLAHDFDVPVVALVPDIDRRTAEDRVLAESASVVWSSTDPASWDRSALPPTAVRR